LIQFQSRLIALKVGWDMFEHSLMSLDVSSSRWSPQNRSGTLSGCFLNFNRYQGWRAETALTPGYFLSPLRGDCRCGSQSFLFEPAQLATRMMAAGERREPADPESLISFEPA